MTNEHEIQIPTLVLNKNIAIQNLERMVKKTGDNGIAFRPHFKTHQSAEIGEWYRNLGVDKITVSSIRMALYFAEHGWSDITIAFPVNLREIDSITNLAAKIKLNLLVDSPETVQSLDENLDDRVGVWIEIDTGDHRSGIDWEDREMIKRIAKVILEGDNTDLRGLLTHSGFTYDCTTKEEIIAVYNSTEEKMNGIRDSLSDLGIEILISVGDTPSCSVLDQFGKVDELRPGNFIFYDLMQLQIGSCKEEDIPLAIACPVVSKYELRQELILYCGAIHVSKDYIEINGTTKCYGKLASKSGPGWGKIIDDSNLYSISQEHGVLKVDRDLIQSTSIGDFVYIIPAHSCLTVNLMADYLTLDGEWIGTMNSVVTP
ncbi:MAG: alanine racemase [Bacteroidetes bacterium]|nr:alanine racemase [Bacteroidota bacterium]